LGRASSEATYLIKGIHQGRNYTERLIWGTRTFLCAERGLKARMMAGGISFFVFLSIFFEKQRAMFFVVMAYFFIWALFFSYEIRTLALVFPFIAWLISRNIQSVSRLFGIEAGTEKEPLPVVEQMVSRPIWKYVFAVLAVVILILNFSVFSSSNLIARQRKLQREILDPELNHRLFEYYDRFGFDGKVASLYWPQKYLPDIGKYYFPLRVPTSLALLGYLTEREDIHYLLISMDGSIANGFSMTEEPALRFLEEGLAKGTFKIIFKHKNLGFIRIRGGG
jgi:hypothetical protein